MKLFLVRHGETEDNVSWTTIGQSAGGKLTKLGKLQAQKIGQRLKAEHFDYAYVSDLSRAVETAQEIIKRHPGLKVEQTTHLRERKVGIHAGRGRLEVRQALKRSKRPFHKYQPRAGESYENLQKRVVNFLNQLTKKHQGENILVVSHGAALATLILHLLGKPISQENFRAHLPPNTALSIFELDEQSQFKPKLLNSTKHLGDSNERWDPSEFTA